MMLNPEPNQPRRRPNEPFIGTRAAVLALWLAACSLSPVIAADPERPGPGAAGDACLTCHAGFSASIKDGMHPAIIAGIGEATAALIPSCTTCHSTHAAGGDAPQADTNVSNKGCLSCHAKSHPAWFAPQRLTPHNALDCVSCHSMHAAAGPAHLPIEPLSDASLCLQCHDDYDMVLDTPHDLRESAATTTNSRGRTAETGGPCSACHNIHSEAVAKVVGPADPGGRCLPCHQTGGVGASRAAVPFSHPLTIGADHISALRDAVDVERDLDALTCADCHNPHSDDYPLYLREKPETLCGACHDTPAALAGGLHDFHNRTDFRNAKGQSTSEVGSCGQCHTMHAASGPALWAGPTAHGSNPPGTARCLGCHTKGGRGPVVAYKPHPAIPMRTLVNRNAAGALPLRSAEGVIEPRGTISCLTCHLPHGREHTTDQPTDPLLLRASRLMLRPYVAPSLCTSCHGFDGLRRFLRFHELAAKTSPNPGD